MRHMLIIACLPLAACSASNDQGVGTAGTRDFAVRDFTGVALRGSDEVTVTTGGDFAVRAEGDSRTLEKLEVDVADGVLRITRKGSSGWLFGGGDSGRSVTVRVTMPRITTARISGSGDMKVDRGEGDFSGAVSGSGNLTIGELRAGKVDLTISGSGDIRASGQGSALDASISGSGDIRAGKLAVATASLSTAGSGDIDAQASGATAITINGSGNVRVSGGANCTIRRSGSGEATCS